MLDRTILEKQLWNQVSLDLSTRVLDARIWVSFSINPRKFSSGSAKSDSDSCQFSISNLLCPAIWKEGDVFKAVCGLGIRRYALMRLNRESIHFIFVHGIERSAPEILSLYRFVIYGPTMIFFTWTRENSWWAKYWLGNASFLLSKSKDIVYAEKGMRLTGSFVVAIAAALTSFDSDVQDIHPSPTNWG